MGGYFLRHKILTSFLVLVLLLVVSVAGFVGYRMRGPYRSYRVDFVLPATGAPAPGTLEVGVAKRDITPDLSQYDVFNDVDNDGRYKKGVDTFEDRNGNGKFDAVWMAGFSSNRPAKGVHDPLWARAIAVRNNGVTVAMVTLDSIGVMHEKIIAVRKSIDPGLKVDHVIVNATHNHEAPDTMGNWSNTEISLSGVLAMFTKANFDQAYMERVQQACQEAVEEAVRNLQPADMVLAKMELDPEKFVKDTRKPIVHDKTLCLARFVKTGTDETIGTMISWGNHAETLGSRNSELTSDFCHYLREGVEKGVPEPNGVEGLGGMCLYFQGMVGGLMTQLHLTVPHRDGQRSFSENSWEKAEALGENVAIEAVKALRSPEAWRVEKPQVAVAAKTIFAPIDGPFKYAIMLGLIHPGWYGGKARTEVNAVRLGDLEILTVPGELYPEIAEGGIESPEGADFAIEPVEVPPLRQVMQGKVKMVFGLANDEIGYIIPKSQWDVEKPYAYGETDEPQYGEENSGGPEVAPIIHKEAMGVLVRLHDALGS